MAAGRGILVARPRPALARTGLDRYSRRERRRLPGFGRRQLRLVCSLHLICHADRRSRQPLSLYADAFRLHQRSAAPQPRARTGNRALRRADRSLRPATRRSDLLLARTPAGLLRRAADRPLSGPLRHRGRNPVRLSRCDRRQCRQHRRDEAYPGNH